MSTAAWELVFMMVVLKLPIVYLIGVVWYAVRAEPRPPAPVVAVAGPRDAPHCPWTRARRPPRPHGPRPRTLRRAPS